MSGKPIIFSAPMILALLEGRKTQTRRILRPQPACYQNPPAFSWGRFHGLYPDDWFGYGNEIDAALPYSGGDRLWVREAWQAGPPALPSGAGIMLPSTPMPGHKVIYRADGDDYIPKVPWRSPIYMPRWASRLTLTVTDVRVQRLQEISREDAVAEGCARPDLPPEFRPEPGAYVADERTTFAIAWNRFHGRRAWNANPWVVALTFTVEHQNKDER